MYQSKNTLKPSTLVESDRENRSGFKRLSPTATTVFGNAYLGRTAAGDHAKSLLACAPLIKTVGVNAFSAEPRSLARCAFVFPPSHHFQPSVSFVIYLDHLASTADFALSLHT